jgi:hypothetical protein
LLLVNTLGGVEIVQEFLQKAQEREAVIGSQWHSVTQEGDSVGAILIQRCTMRSHQEETLLTSETEETTWNGQANRQK